MLALGSSRVAFGVRPGVLPNDGCRPVLVNFALAGGGPVMGLLAYRRAVADGVRPAAVVVEYWPAFLRQDGPYREEARFDRARLGPADDRLVGEFFHDPAATRAAVRRDRLRAVSSHRQTLLNLAVPRWLPAARQTGGTWQKVDGWGWLPGREAVDPADVPKAWAATRAYYEPLFAGFHVGADSDRAFDLLAADARAAGVRMALVYLPEAAAFTALMPAAAKAAADRHLTATVGRLGVPLIDGRGWVADDRLPDGFHLTQAGAAEFTARLAAEIDHAFGDLR